jgi:hypothetical protein
MIPHELSVDCVRVAFSACIYVRSLTRKTERTVLGSLARDFLYMSKVKASKAHELGEKYHN